MESSASINSQISWSEQPDASAARVSAFAAAKACCKPSTVESFWNLFAMIATPVMLRFVEGSLPISVNTSNE